MDYFSAYCIPQIWSDFLNFWISWSQAEESPMRSQEGLWTFGNTYFTILLFKFFYYRHFIYHILFSLCILHIICSALLICPAVIRPSLICLQPHPSPAHIFLYSIYSICSPLKYEERKKQYTPGHMDSYSQSADQGGDTETRWHELLNKLIFLLSLHATDRPTDRGKAKSYKHS